MKLIEEVKIPDCLKYLCGNFCCFVYLNDESFSSYINRIEFRQEKQVTGFNNNYNSNLYVEMEGFLHIDNEYLNDIDNLLMNINELKIRKSKSIIYDIEQLNSPTYHNSTRMIFPGGKVVREGDPLKESAEMYIKFKIKLLGE